MKKRQIKKKITSKEKQEKLIKQIKNENYERKQKIVEILKKINARKRKNGKSMPGVRS